MPGNKIPREVTLLQNSAERLTRVYKTAVFDKMNVAFIKREVKLHLKLTLKLLRKIYWGR
jgi:hypothetical protein